MGDRIEEYDNFILCHTGQTPGLYDTRLSIIQVYAPTEKAIKDEIDKFYYTLNKAIDKSHKDFILMGDWNAKIGKPRKEEYLVTKPNGYGERNERGQLLMEFANIVNKIVNTFFKKKVKNRWTWHSPDKKYKNEIDLVLSKRPQIFQNIEVLNIKFPSDHRPVRATILFAHTKSRTKYNNHQKKTITNEDDISQFNKYHQKPARNSKQKQKTHKILSELQLMERRKELQKTKPKSRTIKNEISALYKLISKYIRKYYSNHTYNTIEKHIIQTGGTKKAYKELQTHKTWIEGLKQGKKTHSNRKDIITVATQFYKELYNIRETTNTNGRVHYLSPNIRNPPIPQIEISEVIAATKTLKSGKSPGIDGITNEILKTDSETLIVHLTELFNLILNTGETPTQWSESDIILIYKKGDPNDIVNYRPISLVPAIYKLFSSIVNKRIYPTVEARQPVKQAGFRNEYSTIDHIHTLELLTATSSTRMLSIHNATPVYINLWGH
ncbi:unnamed protein product [Pieris macdunnoughi]|uniref:Endonuclease/exonuclease/phosphatase domain-containing protein n=1 Tax=Pieris macdunnoughi TaxID=345717 RepID=A0A821S1W2_9NEOP|nr:unnamed protein product [Pieris macdunnoughi]